MVGSSWFSIRYNKDVNSIVHLINDESTPLVLYSGKIKSYLLNINRGLTPYLFSTYSDELENIRSEIDSRIVEYQEQLSWLAQVAQKDKVVLPYYESITAGSEEALLVAEKILAIHYQYLDKRELGMYAQADFPLIFIKINNELQRLSASGYNSSVIDKIASQISVIEAHTKHLLTVSESGELEREIKTSTRKQTAFLKLTKQVQQQHPVLFKMLEDSFSSIQREVFSETGVIALHHQSSVFFSEVQNLRIEFEFLLDKVLESIDKLSDYATQIAQQYYTISEEKVKQSFTAMLVGVSISIIVAVVIGIWISRTIRLPVTRINRALDNIAAKDLNARVDHQSRNELGKVASKVNLMADQLSEVITQMLDSTRKLNNLSMENQLSSSGLSTAIEEQSAQLMSVASAMEQIELSVSEIADAANYSKTEVEQAVSCSDEGRCLMTNNISLMGTLSDKLEESADTINRLGRDSEEIETILEAISAISEQTNLLALNAAIEAARAGEQGRGFAVVADEVRVLASRTTLSANEIRQKIDKLQTRARNAVNEVAECKSHMSEYSVHAAGVNVVLSRLHGYLKGIELSSHQIVSSTAEHKVAATEVTTSIGTLHEIAAENTHSAHDLAALGKKLELMAESQSALASDFKLNVT